MSASRPATSVQLKTHFSAKRASFDGRLEKENESRHRSREDQWQRRTAAKHAPDDFLVVQSGGDDDAPDPPLTVPAPPRYSSLGAAFALVATAKDSRRSFYDHACQTDPDMLIEHVQVVDDSSESQFRRAGIAAAEQIDRVLLAESESTTSVTTAVVHRDPSPQKRLSRAESPAAPAALLHPPTLHAPLRYESERLKDFLSCKELRDPTDPPPHAPHAQMSNSMLHLPPPPQDNGHYQKGGGGGKEQQQQERGKSGQITGGGQKVAPITTIQFNVQQRQMPLRGRSDRRNVERDRRSVALPPSGGRFRYFGAPNASVSDMRAYGLKAAKKSDLSQSLHSLSEDRGVQHGWHRPVWTSNADGEEVLVQAVMY